MKKLLIILSLLLSIFVFPATAYTFSAINEDGVTIYYDITDEEAGTVSVIRNVGFKYSGAVVIPETVEYNSTIFTVTTIGDFAFDGCTGLTEITIPNSVISIDDYAFYRCSNLSQITIPNSVISIGSCAFYGCTGLTEITIPNSVISIGNYAFNGCTGLTEIIIPNSVTSIGDSAFYGCSNLSEITIPNSVTSIGSRAFSGCTGLTEVNIPKSVTSIGNYTFNGCTALSKLTIEDGESILSLGDNNNRGLFGDCPLESVYIGRNLSYKESSSYGYSPFAQNENLKSVTFGHSVSSISNYLFYGCSDLSEITIPNSVTSIGNNAFYGCTGLTEITIPNSVTSIGNSVFYDCSNLTAITIPNSVTSIGNYAFNGCTALSNLIIEDGESRLSLGYNTSAGWYESERIQAKGLFYDCPLNSVYIGRNISFYNADYGDYYSDTYAPFSNNKHLKSVTVGNSVTKISGKSFFDDSELTSINLGNSVESIESQAFSGCTRLLSITIPHSVKKIGNWIAYDGEGKEYLGTKCALKEVHISDLEAWCNIEFELLSNPLYFAHNLYLNDELLQDLIIPETITTINPCTFINCANITSLTIHESVTTIHDRAFSGCTGLTSLTIPESLTTIGGAAFSGCTGLTSLTIPESIEYVGNSAFDGCSNIKNLIVKGGNTFGGDAFPSSLESIIWEPVNVPQNMFRNCKDLKKLVLGENVAKVGSQAFQYCEALQSVECLNKNVAPAGTYDVFPASIYPECALYVPAKAVGRYYARDPWANFHQIIPMITSSSDDSNAEPNRLYSNGVAAKSSQTAKLNMLMDNESEITAFQCDIYIPEGCSAAGEDEYLSAILSDRADASHSITTNRLSDGGFRVAAYSSTNAPFADNKGALFCVEFVMPETAGGYHINVKNIKLTTPEEKEITPGDFSVAAVSLTYLLGDSNGDNNVTITDAVNTINYVLEKNPETFIFDSADVNLNNQITITDAVGTVNIIMAQDFALAGTSTPDIAQPGLSLYIDDFEIAAGDKKTVGIGLHNVFSISAMQFDVTLPYGLEVEMTDDKYNIRETLRASDSHMVVSSQLQNNTYRIISYSSESDDFTGTEGDVIEFTLMSDDAFEGITSEIVISNVIITTSDAEEYLLPDYIFVVNNKTLDSPTILSDENNEDVIYFDLQGIRVASPGSGIYLRRQGNEVKKIVIP